MVNCQSTKLFVKLHIRQSSSPNTYNVQYASVTSTAAIFLFSYLSANYLSTLLPAKLQVHLSTSLPTHWTNQLQFRQQYLSACLPVYVSEYPSTVHLSFPLFGCLLIYCACLPIPWTVQLTCRSAYFPISKSLDSPPACLPICLSPSTCLVSLKSV
jgi:hypothetical protein